MAPRNAPAPAAKAALVQAQAEAKQRKAPAKTAAAKASPAKAAKSAAKVEQEKVVYAAMSRSGRTNTRSSATPVTHALDVRIAGRKGAQFAQGVVVGFFTSAEKAQKAADEINGGSAGSDWTDAVVVKATPVGTAVSA